MQSDPSRKFLHTVIPQNTIALNLMIRANKSSTEEPGDQFWFQIWLLRQVSCSAITSTDVIFTLDL
jgi:hypothetical protein